MDLPPTGHEPVLLDETLAALDLTAKSVVVDCTLGRAGHALAIAGRLGADGLLIGLDADERNLLYAEARLKAAPCPVRLFHANFSQLTEVLETAGIHHVDALLADLGISTNQLFDPRYGLSFDRDTPLDMRIDVRTDKSAADLVNRLSETDLANVLYELAQERYSRRIARKIVEARAVSPILTTERLAELVRSAIPPTRGRDPGKMIDPATRTFLALRMAVNREMDNLAALLADGPRRLAPSGTMAVISFQSMEDRAVKQAFRSLEQANLVDLVTKKPIAPSDDEIAANPRSRSAKLRVIRKKPATLSGRSV